MIAMMKRNELCDGFANRSTNRFFLSFGLFLAEITLSFLICICTQLLIIFGTRERTYRVFASRPGTNNDIESSIEHSESQKLFSYVEWKCSTSLLVFLPSHCITKKSNCSSIHKSPRQGHNVPLLLQNIGTPCDTFNYPSTISFVSSHIRNNFYSWCEVIFFTFCSMSLRFVSF